MKVPQRSWLFKVKVHFKLFFGVGMLTVSEEHHFIKYSNEKRVSWTVTLQQLTFVHSHPTVVTLDDLVCVLAVVSQADAADEDVLSAPGLGPVQRGILGNGEAETRQSYLSTDPSADPVTDSQ